MIKIGTKLNWNGEIVTIVKKNKGRVIGVVSKIGVLTQVKRNPPNYLLSNGRVVRGLTIKSLLI